MDTIGTITRMLRETGYFQLDTDNPRALASRIVKVVRDDIEKERRSDKATAMAKSHDDKMRVIYEDEYLQARIDAHDFNDVTQKEIAEALDYDLGAGTAAGFSSFESSKLTYNLKWCGYKRKQVRKGAKTDRYWFKVPVTQDEEPAL